MDEPLVPRKRAQTAGGAECAACGTAGGAAERLLCAGCARRVAVCGGCAAAGQGGAEHEGHTLVWLPPRREREPPAGGAPVPRGDDAVLLLADALVERGDEPEPAAAAQVPPYLRRPTPKACALAVLSLLTAALYAASSSRFYDGPRYVYECDGDGGPGKVYMLRNASFDGCTYVRAEAHDSADPAHVFVAAHLLMRAWICVSLVYLAVQGAVRLGASCGCRCQVGRRALAGLHGTSRPGRGVRAAAAVGTEARLKGAVLVAVLNAFLCFPVASVGGRKLLLALDERTSQLVFAVSLSVYSCGMVAWWCSACTSNAARKKRLVLVLPAAFFVVLLGNIVTYVAVVTRYSDRVDTFELLHPRGHGYELETFFNLFSGATAVTLALLA